MENINQPNPPSETASLSYKKWRQRFLQIVLWGAAIAGLLAVLSTLGETNLGVKIAYFVAYGILLLTEEGVVVHTEDYLWPQVTGESLST